MVSEGAGGAPPGPLMTIEDSRRVLRDLQLRGLDGYGTLTPHERARAGRLPAGRDRRDYVAAHLLVRICAARLARVPLRSLVIEQHCPECGGRDHGKPSVKDHSRLRVSLSHTAGTVAAVAGWSAVGIDVETTAGFSFDRRLAERVLGHAEAAALYASPDPSQGFLRHWVRKEALVKAGHGSLFGPAAPDTAGARPGTHGNGPRRTGALSPPWCRSSP